MDLYKEPARITLSGHELFVNGRKHGCNVRTLNQMREVFLTAASGPVNLYYMYRAVYTRGPLRYDVTLIPSSAIGHEFSKTYGHYHPNAPDGIAYPELYQVLLGEACFVLQKKLAGEAMVVVAVHAKKGDIVLFPPDFGHVSINPSNKDLILANIVSSRFESDYSEYKKFRGAAYYYTTNGFIKNNNYVASSFEEISASDFNARYKFSCIDLLATLHKHPEKFEFLDKPGLYFK